MTDQVRQLLEQGFRLGGETTISSPKPYEAKWISRWRVDRVFEAHPDLGRRKFFICVPYSYQNGPLHLGHGFTFTRGDAVARYMRMRGYNVLFPWAWHWTGEAVAGTSERLKKGDESVKRMLLEIDGVPESLLNNFTHPEFICAYYTAENRKVVDAMGWSVDWSREFHTTDLHPYYSRFIEWQYHVLRRNGLLVQGRHPVVWCPKCQSATGDHDRLRGEGIYPEEYTMVFFELDGVKLAAATLRPETIFGVTNVWIHPDGVYQVVERNGVKLLMSREAVAKLGEQLGLGKVVKEMNGHELLGKYVRSPFTGRAVPILPAKFVDVSLGTGVVYSVPAHAPYDYIAVKELRNNPGHLREKGLDPKLVEVIQPIKVIETPGLGEHPAVDAVEKAGITSQLDERLEELTREIYSKEFYSGKMVVEEFRDVSVSVAREKVIERLKQNGDGDVFYDLSGKVICRSGDECIVKIVDDQWFLNFSNTEWKARVKRLISSMNVYPEAARTWLLNVVDWLHDWACTRKTGLGTRLPWDPSWIIETLSDSTIYPALYTISKILNKFPEKAAKLGVEVFDYVFLGLGDPRKLAEKYGLEQEHLESMRREFLYWYGVDLRVSGKDLVANHLTFYLFHHTGIFEEKHWPRGVAVNGMITIEGNKMSKSRGNFVTLKQAIARHGSDATRLALLLSAEDLDDPDWREKAAEEAGAFVKNFLTIIEKIANEASDDEGPCDEWLLAATDRSCEIVSENLEKLKTRSACSEAVYGMLNNWRWYIRRNRDRITRAAKVFAEKWILILSPFAPFAAEEAWEKLGRKGYASLQEWPKPSMGSERGRVIFSEMVLESLLSDVREVLGLVKGKPVEVKLYRAAGWKHEAAKVMLSSQESNGFEAVKRNRPELLRQDPSTIRKIADNIRDLTQKASSLTEQPATLVAQLLEKETNLLKELADFVKHELNIETTLHGEEDAAGDREKTKAKQALPLKPAIYVVAK